MLALLLGALTVPHASAAGQLQTRNGASTHFQLTAAPSSAASAEADYTAQADDPGTLAGFADPARAADVKDQAAEVQPSGRGLVQASPSQFADALNRNLAVVQGCATLPGQCRSNAVSPDMKVSASGATPAFTVHWQWLRDALDNAARSKSDARAESMNAAAARLQEMAVDAGIVAPSNADKSQQASSEAAFGKARAAVNNVLSAGEFEQAKGPSWLDRLWAKIWNWIDRVFAGAGKIGESAPWLGRFFEWLLFLGASVGLLLFLQRNFQRARLGLSGGAAAAAPAGWTRDATDWAALADASAAAGEWREAVHCLYWAGIVHLESRRFWRHNPARTPREYVRLLKPESPQQRALAGLTALLERVWYGLRAAGAADYARARALFQELDAATPTPEDAHASAATASQSERA